MDKSLGTSQNKTRQVELDLAKALAIIFMIFVHTHEAHCFLENIEEGAGFVVAWIIEFLGGVPAAPLFMLAMGVGVVYSKRSTSVTYLKRAVKMFGVGIIVNIFQQWIPILLRQNAAEEFTANVHSIIATDIYSFVAVIMLFFAFLKTTKHPVTVTTIALIACLVINEITYPNSIATGSDWIDSIIGIFVRTNDYSYFPFFTWAFWPLIGYLFGTLLIKLPAEKKMKMYCVIAITGIVAMVVATYVFNMNPNDNIVNSLIALDVDEGLYYAMDTWNILWSYGLLSIEMFILYVIVRLTNFKIPNLFAWMSKNIMSIYVIQWIYIGLATPLFDRVTDTFVCIVNCVVVLVLSLVTAWLWNKFKDRHKKNAATVTA